MQQVWKDARGRRMNLMALSYAVGGWLLGWAGLLSGSWLLAAPATLLLAHSMVIAAYMIHECAHNTVFRDNRHNARLGKALSWLVGGCYGSYEGIRNKHFRHHVDRADVVAFDYRNFLRRRPWLLKTIQAAEWLWIPATDLLMHAFVIAAPFHLESYRKEKPLVIRAAVVRVGLFAVVGWYHWPALVGYAVAYCLFLIVLRTMDMHQHTFDVSFSLDAKVDRDKYDRAFEDRNTFSNLISRRYPWLNLLVLNFGYHNAHHIKPTAPWYDLPALHATLEGTERDNGISFLTIMKSYHRFRVRRVLHEDYPDTDIGSGADRGQDFIGVYGVSFLTAL